MKHIPLGESYRVNFHNVIRSLDEQGLETLRVMICGEQALRQHALEQEVTDALRDKHAKRLDKTIAKAGVKG